MTRATRHIWLITLVLVLAAALRLWALDDAPPGMQHDELFKAQEGRAIITQGDIRFFYPSNQGHEGGYVWLISVAYALVGANLLMVKLPAFWCGLLTLALLYRVGREVFNPRVALLATALAAVSFWMLSTNRVGLRANSLPLVTLLVVWGLWRLLYATPPGERVPRGWVIFTGGMLGLAIYTYTAAPALYAAIGLLVVWLALRDRAVLRRRWRALGVVLLLGGLLTLPMLDTRLNNPQGTNRASSINQPWQDLQDGDPAFVQDNARRLAGMFAFTGDPEARYNLPGRPLFWPPIGLLAYLGVGLLLVYAWRRPFLIVFVGLLLAGLIPSLLTLSAPSYLRSIITLPSVMLGLAVAVDALGRARWVWGVGLVVVGVTGARDVYAYFHTWAADEAVFAVYRDDLAQLADYTHTIDANMVMASTGFPQTLDPGMYAYANPDPATEVAWFNGNVSMLLSRQPRYVFISPLAPVSAAHAHWLTPDYGAERLPPLLRQDGGLAFEVYRIAPAPLQDQLAAVARAPFFIQTEPSRFLPSPNINEWGTPLAAPVNFGGVVAVLGYDMPSRFIPWQDNRVDNGLQLQLYLQPLIGAYDAPLSLFVHLLSADGLRYAGRDFLGAPSDTWHPDIIILQDHYIGNYEVLEGRYFVALGVYDPQTGERYPVLDEDGAPIADRVFLGFVEAVPPGELDLYRNRERQDAAEGF